MQNFLIVAASYLFYGWWDWRFLGLILFSSLLDFFVGRKMRFEERPSRRKVLLWTSVVVNLGFLGVFKYYNFFLENFISAFSFFGAEIKASSIQIILPVGISFYTFQTLSYTIDIYRRKLEPTKDFIAFAAFVSFFPQLVAGPIERASQLLPQFSGNRFFDYSKSVDGLRQILWGLFKKVVIADNCAEYANLIFNNSTDYSGTSLALGALFFSFQIYGDFSGYSDIAIGIAKLFGFELMRNFAFPYFSRDIAEFWRRWHISLSTWFRDYLYIPLGGSRVGTPKRIRNTFIIFVVSGFWHGANWTFIIWGLLNALYFLPLLITRNNRNHLEVIAKGKLVPSFRELSLVIFTFSLTVFAWIFFRAENIGHALQFIHDMLTGLKYSWGYSQNLDLLHRKVGYVFLCFFVVFIIVEWLGRNSLYAIERIPILLNRPLKYMFYYIVSFSIFWFGGEEQQFIYFQF